MVELVDTYALGAYAARCAGSNPVPGTKQPTSVKRKNSPKFGTFLFLIDFFIIIWYNVIIYPFEVYL